MKSSWWAVTTLAGVLMGRGDQVTDVCRRKTWAKTAVHTSRREASGNPPAEALVFDFPPPELGEIRLRWFQPHICGALLRPPQESRLPIARGQSLGAVGGLPFLSW